MKSTETEVTNVANLIMFAMLGTVAVVVLNPMLAVGWEYLVEIFQSAFDSMNSSSPASPFGPQPL